MFDLPLSSLFLRFVSTQTCFLHEMLEIRELSFCFFWTELARLQQNALEFLNARHKRSLCLRSTCSCSVKDPFFPPISTQPSLFHTGFPKRATNSSSLAALHEDNLSSQSNFSFYLQPRAGLDFLQETTSLFCFHAVRLYSLASSQAEPAAVTSE